MPEGNSIINIGDISKPATALIEKISGAVGGYFRPYQIRRVAKAEAEADVIKAQAQIEINDLQRRALTRFVAEEAKRQDNIEQITKKAIPHLEDSSTPQNMEDDWITNFFDKCRIVSDKEMQSLWAKVLAGEANSPGTYSNRTVNLLGSLDKTDAHLFTNLCGFGWLIGKEVIPLIYDEKVSFFNDRGINFSTLIHLDDIGLINFNSFTGFKQMGFLKKAVFHYYGSPLTVEFKNTDENEMETGKARLTKTGLQLASICESKPVDGFLDYIIERWAKEGFILASPYPRQK